jgi:hypothetical protein
VDTFYFDKINVGGSLTALLHSFVTNTPILIDQPHFPFELDFCPPDWDLSFLGFPNGMPVNKLHLWERLAFLMSMSGMVVFPNNVQDVRANNFSITVVTTDKQRINIKFKELLAFDKDRDSYYLVYDWFYVKSGATHELEVLMNGDGFCSQIIFHPTIRPSLRKEIKDICVVSKIACEDIDHIDYSPIYVRLKTLKMMQEAGIRGKINGYNRSGSPKYLSPRIEHAFREKAEVIHNHFTIEGLLQKKINKNSDLWKLTQKFVQSKTRSTLQALSR